MGFFFWTISLSNSLVKKKKLFPDIKFIIGVGTWVCFWLDLWCRDSCLRDLFPELFTLTVDKNASIASCLGDSAEWGAWYRNPQFSKPFQDWGLESMENLLDLFYSSLPSSQGKDQVSWKLTKSGKFDVW